MTRICREDLEREARGFMSIARNVDVHMRLTRWSIVSSLIRPTDGQ